MGKRILKASAFAGGGVFTGSLLAVLQGFGRSQAAMSAGTVGPPRIDALIPLFAASYFFVSAAGILFCSRKQSLVVTAIIAHVMLLMTFLGFCAEAADTDKFLTYSLLMAVITIAYFSPWLIAWASMLFTKPEAPAPTSSKNSDTEHHPPQPT